MYKHWTLTGWRRLWDRNFYTTEVLQYPYQSSGQGMDIGNKAGMNLFIASFFVIISLAG